MPSDARHDGGHGGPKLPELTMDYSSSRGSLKQRPASLSSGTRAWEAALTNTLSPGNKVLAPLSLSETHARIYWWCSPPNIGTAKV